MFISQYIQAFCDKLKKIKTQCIGLTWHVRASVGRKESARKHGTGYSGASSLQGSYRALENPRRVNGASVYSECPLRSAHFGAYVSLLYGGSTESSCSCSGQRSINDTGELNSRSSPPARHTAASQEKSTSTALIPIFIVNVIFRHGPDLLPNKIPS